MSGSLAENNPATFGFLRCPFHHSPPGSSELCRPFCLGPEIRLGGGFLYGDIPFGQSHLLPNIARELGDKMRTAVPSDAESINASADSTAGTDAVLKLPAIRPSRPVAYAVAALLVAAALLLRLVLNAVLGEGGPHMPFFPAIALAALYGGLGPGLAAMIVSGIIVQIFFFVKAPVNEPFSFVVLQRFIVFCLFCGTAGLIAWLLHTVRITLRREKVLFRKQQQAEEKAHASDAQFRWAIEQAPFPIALYAEDGTILFLNRVWTELTGYGIEQIPTLSDWIERGSGRKNPTHLKRLALKEINRVFKVGAPNIDHGELVVATARGEKLTWDFSSAALDRLSDGRRVAIVIAKDVTRQNQLEELIWLRTAVESVVTGIAIVDRTGVILWVNPALMKITGYAENELVGKHTRLLKSGLHDNKFYRDLWSTVTAGRVWRGIVCNRRKKREPLPRRNDHHAHPGREGASLRVRGPQGRHHRQAAPANAVAAGPEVGGDRSNWPVIRSACAPVFSSAFSIDSQQVIDSLTNPKHRPYFGYANLADFAVDAANSRENRSQSVQNRRRRPQLVSAHLDDLHRAVCAGRLEGESPLTLIYRRAYGRLRPHVYGGEYKATQFILHAENATTLASADHQWCNAGARPQ